MEFDKIKENQIKKYSSFDIPKEKLDEIFLDACGQNCNEIDKEIDVAMEFDRLVDIYLLNEMKENNLDVEINVIEKYSYIKTIINKNKRYSYEYDMLDKIYEKAIDLLKYRYNYDMTMSRNIISNMKFIIDNNYVDFDINMIDIKFLKIIRR